MSTLLGKTRGGTEKENIEAKKNIKEDATETNKQKKYHHRKYTKGGNGMGKETHENTNDKN